MAKKKNPLTLMDTVKKMKLSLPSPTGRIPSGPPEQKLPLKPKKMFWDIETRPIIVTPMNYHGIRLDTALVDDLADTYETMTKAMDKALQVKMAQNYFDQAVFTQKTYKNLYFNEMDPPVNRYRDAVSHHRHYFNTESLPWADPHFDPDFLSDFTWGPLGEWIGKEVDENIRQKIIFAIRERARNYGIQPFESYGYVASYLRSDIYGGKNNVLLQFSNYDCMEKEVKTIYSAAGKDVSRFFAALLQLKLINIDNLSEWMTALKSRKFACGYGVLRDGDDRYDPFGVLAQINGAKWKWSEHEGAYVLSGEHADPSMLDAETVMSYLGIPADVPERFVRAMINTVIKEVDSRNSFDPVVEMISDATKIVKERQHNLNSMIEGLSPRAYHKRIEKLSLNIGDMDLSPTASSQTNLKVDLQGWRDFRNKYNV